MSSPKYAVAIACLALGLSVSGCGSDPAGNTPGGATNQSGPQPGGAGATGGFGGSGKVAAVTGSTAQVQGEGAQVAVTWTARTAFTQQVAAKASDLKIGDCVMAMPAMDSTAASSGPTASGPTSNVAAATVRISTPVGGSCTNGIRGRGGPRGDRTGAPPSPAGGTEQGRPSGGGGPVRRGAFGAFGKVSAVDGTGFTVESVRPGSSGSSTVTVATSAATEWTRSVKATSKDVKVGRCVASVGKPDSTGAITATSIALSAPVNGRCGAMFGPGPAAGPGAGPGGDDQGGQEGQ
jgi:hypothetical protein